VPSPASLREATSPSSAGRGGRVLDLSMPILPREDAGERTGGNHGCTSLT
jgi:hypothetical protein